MQALKDVSKVWLVAKMVHTLFESILGNKILEERLQKAAGKRHQKTRHDNHALPKKLDPLKRKFDDMDFGFPNGGPTPPVSYERSRPQTPAVTPSRELPPQQPSAPQQGSPSSRMSQDVLPTNGNSRANTRPATPFNAQFSLPTTPPDLFLVTRTSPNLSPSLWENFQPDQLFPDGTRFFPELASPNNAVDPQLQMTAQMQQQGIHQRPMMMNQPPPMSGRGLPGSQGSPQVLSSVPPGLQLPNPQMSQSMFGIETQHPWAMHGLDASLSGAALDAASQDDNWSSSSRSGPTAPTTLNVEDWFQFFGINGGFGEVSLDR